MTSPHVLAPDDRTPPAGSDESLFVRMLGPVEVCHGSACAVLAKPQLRTLLAVLATRHDHVVTVDELIDAIWGSTPPGSAHHAIQVLTSMLRSILDAHGGRHLVSEPPGWRLSLATDEFDVALVMELHDRAHVDLEAGRHVDVVRSLRVAEGLWKGPPYAEFQFDDWAQADIRQLTEVRWSMIEDRLASQLALGLYHDSVPELKRFVVEQPTRERLLELLMLALARSDRPVDAVASFEDARTRLAGEFGCEPGPAVTGLAARIRSEGRA